VATKLDAAQDKTLVKFVEKKAKKAKMPFYKISAVSGEGLQELLRGVIEFVFAKPEDNPEPVSE